MLEITNINLLVGLATGFFIGMTIGYIIGKKSKHADETVSSIQLLAIASLFGYIIVSSFLMQEVSWVIAIAILATGYGAKGGEILEKILEKRK